MKAFWKILRRYVAPYKGYVGGSVVLNILSAVFNVFSFSLLIPILLFSGIATVIQALSKDIPINITIGSIHITCIGGIWILIIARFFTYLAAGGLQPVLQVMLTKVTPTELAIDCRIPTTAEEL